MLLDSDVMVDIHRGYPPAVAWLASLGGTAVALPGSVVLELLQGCPNLAEQRRVQRLVSQFVRHWPTPRTVNGRFRTSRPTA
jgi:predicted nucleic acid-binding protein